MGENLSEAPKASLWVEKLHGRNPLSLKKKQKTKNFTSIFVFYVFFVMLVINGFWNHRESFIFSPLLFYHPSHHSLHSFP